MKFKLVVETEDGTFFSSLSDAREYERDKTIATKLSELFPEGKLTTDDLLSKRKEVTSAMNYNFVFKNKLVARFFRK